MFKLRQITIITTDIDHEDTSDVTSIRSADHIRSGLLLSLWSAVRVCWNEKFCDQHGLVRTSSEI